MSHARDAILASLRQALGRGEADESTRAMLDARIARPPRHIRPALGDELVGRFVRKFEGRSGTLARVADRAEVPAAVAAYAANLGLAPEAAVGAALAELPWPPDWRIHHGAAGIREALAVSPALAGIAETGSLMLAASKDSPTTHNFVPDDHVVVLDAARIVPHFEDAWALLRTREGGLPRATNLVSGPSRTADVEQTIQLGAHGPRRVHVILVG